MSHADAYFIPQLYKRLSRIILATTMHAIEKWGASFTICVFSGDGSIHTFPFRMRCQEQAPNLKQSVVSSSTNPILQNRHNALCLSTYGLMLRPHLHQEPPCLKHAMLKGPHDTHGSSSGGRVVCILCFPGSSVLVSGLGPLSHLLI